MWKQFVSSYLSFTKKERIGIITLLVLIISFMILPLLFPFFIKEKTYDHSQFENEITALQLTKHDSSSFANKDTNNDYENNNSAYYNQPLEEKKYNKQQSELFFFNPNTLDENGWKQLGVKEKTIQTIQKYLSKGGKFHKGEDLGNIWGLPPSLVQRLIPYVKIEEVDNATKNQFEQQAYQKKEYIKEIIPIDVNVADTTAFIALPGIGNKLANRIIAFRNKLGGFYKIDQVGETFLLPDSTFQKIKPRLILTNPFVKKININTVALEELKMHPYLRYYIANAIILYRGQHGNFASIGDIKKVILVTDSIYQKVEPYLEVSE